MIFACNMNSFFLEPDDVDTSDYNDAIQEKYPCHGLVYRKRPKRWRGDHDTRWKYLCGATLINMMTLVTAAHCVHNTSGIDWPNATIYQLRAGSSLTNVKFFEAPDFDFFPFQDKSSL